MAIFKQIIKMIYLSFYDGYNLYLLNNLNG